MDSLEDIKGVYSLFQLAQGDKVTNTTTCTRRINEDIFLYWVTLPSALIILILMAMIKRVRLCLGFLGGRPALACPMNFLEGRGRRLSHAASFGLTASYCMKMISQKYPVEIIGPSYLKIVVKLATMCLYGFALYPLLACMTANTIVSLGLGTLYAWMILIVNILHLTDCATFFSADFYVSNILLPLIPQLICIGFLSITFPIRFGIAVKKWCSGQEKEETEEFFQDSYQAKYVRELFRKIPEGLDDSNKKKGLKTKMKGKLQSLAYRRVKGFRYSPRIMSTFTAGIILLFLLAFQLFSFLINLVKAFLTPLGEAVQMTGDTRPLSEVYGNGSFLSGNPIRDLIIIHHWVYVLLVIICLSLSIACAIGLLQIVFGILSYRDDLLHCARGDYTRIGPCRNYPTLMVAFVRYSGFQVAYIFWAFFLQFMVILIILAVLAYVIFIPLIYGSAMWFIDILEGYWPVLIISLVVNILQKLAACLIFLQKHGKMFAVNNRRLLFCVMYFLFFYNVFIGLFSCILRMLKGLIIGLLYLSRLDSSTLPKRFENMDPGFKAYVGLIHVENAHTHPVLVTFVNMVKHEIEKRSDHQEGKSNSAYQAEENHVIDKVKERQHKVVMMKWYLAYTLINNLKLRAYRKHFMDEEKARLRKRFGIKHEEETVKVGIEMGDIIV